MQIGRVAATGGLVAYDAPLMDNNVAMPFPSALPQQALAALICPRPAAESEIGFAFAAARKQPDNIEMVNASTNYTAVSILSCWSSTRQSRNGGAHATGSNAEGGPGQ